MSADNQKILTAKEVKNFNLFQYVYPDQGDELQPSWNEDGTISITGDDGTASTYYPVTGVIE